MPQLLHVSDTHLGFQSYGKLSPEGLNQREVDFQTAFARVVSEAIESPPDVFLHTGDLFDHPRPTNRAIAFALEQIRRLSAARIPTILVSGNHDSPRLRETGSIFRIFEGMPHVRPVYEGQLEVVKAGGLTVHAVPQAITMEAFQAEVRAAKATGPGPHVLALHGTVLGVDGLFSSEFNEYQLPLSDLRPEFEYVALGHFHNTRAVTPNSRYAGSTEFCSFAEADQTKGYLTVDLAGAGFKSEHHASGARPMRELGLIPSKSLTAADAMEEAFKRLATVEAGSIVRLGFAAVDRPTARAIDRDAIRHHRPDLLHVEFRFEVESDAHAAEPRADVAGVSQEFESFLSRYPLPDGRRESVRNAALDCLQEGRGAPRAS